MCGGPNELFNVPLPRLISSLNRTNQKLLGSQTSLMCLSVYLLDATLHPAISITCFTKVSQLSYV